jgi:hypothetical protein
MTEKIVIELEEMIARRGLVDPEPWWINVCANLMQKISQRDQRIEELQDRIVRGRIMNAIESDDE